MQYAIKGAWDTAKIVEVLTTRNAMCALRGRPCPIAAAVCERLTK